MDILGVGPLEILFIILIALIVLGPKDIAKAGRSIGRFMRSVVKSSSWQAVQQTSKEIRNLPTKLMREAGLEEDMKEIQSILPNKEEFLTTFDVELEKESTLENKISPSIDDSKEDISSWVTPPIPRSSMDATNSQESSSNTSD